MRPSVVAESPRRLTASVFTRPRPVSDIAGGRRPSSTHIANRHQPDIRGCCWSIFGGPVACSISSCIKMTKIRRMTPTIPRGKIIGKQVGWTILSDAEHFWKAYVG
jgi:hypothetical protein